MRRYLLILLCATTAEAQKAPAYHLVCRQIMADEPVKAPAVLARRVGGSDFFAGCTALLERRWADATAAFERAVATDTLDAVYRLWLGRARGVELRRADNPFRQLALLQHVKGDINRAVALDSTFVDARMYQIEMLLLMPTAVGGSVTQARARAEELRALSPFFGALEVARVNAVTGDTSGAERELRALVKAHPDSVAAHVALLELLVGGGRARDARAVIVMMKKTPDLRLIADFYAGYIAVETNENVPAGEAALRRYVTRSRPYGFPMRAIAHRNLARIEERRGRIPQAIAELKASLKLDPDYAAAKKDLERLEKGS